MQRHFVVVLLVALSGVAQASEFSLCNKSERGLIGCRSNEGKFTLADYHSVTPVPVPVPDPVPVPVPNPVVHAKNDFFLLGLGLVGAGLALGGAGFAVLYLCRAPDPTTADAGGSCYSKNDGGKTSSTVGWVLAAPGIIPLAVGAFMVYVSTGGGHHAAGNLVPSDTAPRWALTAMPLNGGGMVSGAFQF